MLNLEEKCTGLIDLFEDRVVIEEILLAEDQHRTLAML
jgi:hypothetical protein